jgi:hypothetical protein
VRIRCPLQALRNTYVIFINPVLFDSFSLSLNNTFYFAGWCVAIAQMVIAISHFRSRQRQEIFLFSPHVLHALPMSFFSMVCHSNYALWRLEALKLLLMLFAPASCHFSPRSVPIFSMTRGSQYYPQSFCSYILSFNAVASWKHGAAICRYKENMTRSYNSAVNIYVRTCYPTNNPLHRLRWSALFVFLISLVHSAQSELLPLRAGSSVGGGNKN